MHKRKAVNLACILIGLLIVVIQLVLLLLSGNLRKRVANVNMDTQTADNYFGITSDKTPTMASVILENPIALQESTIQGTESGAFNESDSTVTAVPRLDLQALQKVNPDTVGWIWIPGTEINYPVVQTSNNSYYLNHGFDGERSAEGAIFLVSRCDPAGDVRIIYGHNTSSGKFDSLNRYLEEGERYLQDHPVFYYFSADHPEGVIYDIFSVLIADLNDAEGIEQIYQYKLTLKTNYIDTLKQESQIIIDQRIINTDRNDVILLSTCGYSDYQRCLICGASH